MSGSHRRILTSALAALTVIAGSGADPVNAANAGFHLTKTVSGATITPVLSLTLAVDKSTALPGDTLKYSGSVSNSGDSWAISGQFTAESHMDSDATLASYWDEVQYCLSGCGNGLNDHWTALAGTANAQAGYTPATPSDIATGLTLTATPAAEANVTYPSSGDPILGTAIAAGATAIWTYTATIALTPAQVALLSDPARVAALRNVAHFEAAPRNSNAAQPWTDSATVTNGFQAATNAAAASNAVVSVVLPDGTTSKLDSSLFPDLASIRPGAQIPWSTPYQVPAPAAKAAGETDAAYLGRLGKLDGATLTATATVSATGSSGPVTASAPAPSTTVEQLPIVSIAKSGPTKVDAGTTETNPLALNNSGHAAAAALAVTDAVPGGATGTITGLPASLAPGGTVNASAAFPVPASQPPGTLTDTAALTWQDANANAYGPVSSSFSTTVNSSLAGAKLTLAPPTAGPDVVGTKQAFTATLVDSAGKPLPGQTVTLSITGANPDSETGTTDANGNAAFSYSGANKGSDQVQATVTSGTFTLSSNTVTVAWLVPFQTVSTTLVNGRFFHAPDCWCGFTATPSTPVVFTQQLPTIDLNPPAGTIPHNPTGIGVWTRPMYDVTTDIGGSFTGAILVQGADSSGVVHQAGSGDMFVFNAVFTATYVVAAPGNVTFNFFSDDGFIFGVDGGATRVDGPYVNAPGNGLTPFQSYPVMGAFNQPTAPVANNITVHFPAAGTYNYEVDYGECCGGQLAITMATNGTGLPPTGNLSLTPFAPPTNTVGKTQGIAVAAMDANGAPLSGIAITLNVTGANPQQVSSTTGSNGVASFSYQAANAGVDHLQGSALVSGVPELSNIVDLTWNPAPPAPTISGLSLPDGGLVSKPIAIAAGIAPPSGQTISSWRVYYQALDPGPQVVIASGTGTPPTTLATFDPTLLPNDAYAVTVEATASGGGVQSATSTVTVIGNLKIGRYTTTYQDLSLPVNGFQMQVRRSYDSIDKSQGDFGVGWRVSVGNFRTAPNRVLGAGGWTQYNSSCALGLCLTAFRDSAPRFVSVAYPDGRTEIFDFTPQGGTNLFWGCTPQFTARTGTGTTSTLVPLDDTGCSYNGDGNLYGANGPYNPQRFQLTTLDGRVLVLDTHLGLVSEKDRGGNTLSIDANGIHASNGQSVTYARDGSGRISMITGPSGQTLNYTYSSAGDLATSTDPNGNVTSYSYDATHDLLNTRGGARPSSSYQYDASGRLVGVTDAAGHTVSISSDVGAQTQTFNDAAGALTTVDYFDNLGDLLREDQIAGGTTLTSTYTYDGLGNVLTSTDPLGEQKAWQYDANGNVTLYTDPAGVKTHFSYDSNSGLTAITADSGALIQGLTYDSSGNVVALARADGTAYHYGYDGSGHLTTVSDPMNRTLTLAYDSFGHLAKVTDPTGVASYTTSDASGRVLTETDGNGLQTSYAYDVSGNVLRVTDPAGNHRDYTYDAGGRALTEQDPLGHTTTYQYDSLGRLAQVTERNGATVTYAYDPDGRLLTETQSDGELTSFQYDAFGHLTDALNGSAEIVLSRDAAGRATSQLTKATTSSQLPSVTLAYQYDPAGNLVGLSGPGGTTHYVYDAQNQLATVTDPAGGHFNFRYDAVGRLISMTRPNGVNDALNFDSGDFITAIDALSTAGAVSQAHYGASARAQRSTLTDLLGTHSFSHDAGGRLTAATHPTGGPVNESYQYDSVGNRTATAAQPPGSFTYDVGSRLLGDANYRYAYDAEGDLVSKAAIASGATTSYDWNPNHQLLAVHRPDGTAVTFKYDPFGQRVEIGSPGSVTRYAYDDGNINAEFDGNNQLLASYVNGLTLDSPLEMSRGGNRYFFAEDGGGSITALLDANGAVADSYTYDTFGNQTHAGSVANPFSFAGREFDASTGLYFFRARYYDPTAGRFISEDPVAAVNPYVYAGNDAVDANDPTGMLLAEDGLLRTIVRRVGAFLSFVGLRLLKIFICIVDVLATILPFLDAASMFSSNFRGDMGENMSAARETYRGNEVIGRQPTIEAGGVRTRPDIVVRQPDGSLKFVESKNGPNARLTPNQERGYPSIRQSGGVPRGANANNVDDFRFGSGKPIGPTPVQEDYWGCP